MLCRGVRDICSNFNLTDELSTVVKSLEMEAKRLTSSKARADADATIADLIGFIDKLSSDKPAISQIGECQCNHPIVEYDYHANLFHCCATEDRPACASLQHVPTVIGPCLHVHKAACCGSCTVAQLRTLSVAKM